MRVPTYDQATQRSAPLPRPFVPERAPAGAFGEEVAQGITRLGSALDDVQDRARKQQELARLQTARAHMVEFTNGLLFRPDTGALNQKGQKALRQGDDVLANLDQVQTAVIADLPPDAREQFDLWYQSHRISVHQDLLRHSTREGDALAVEAFNRDADALTEEAVLYAADRSKFETKIEELRADVVGPFAEANGRPPEWVEAETKKRIARVAARGVMNLLTQENAPRARELLTEYRAEIGTVDPDGGLERAVKKLEIETETVRVADTLTEGLDKPRLAAGDYDRVEQGLRKIADLDTRQAAAAEVARRMKWYEEKWGADEDAAYEEAVAISHRAGTSRAVPKTLYARIRRASYLDHLERMVPGTEDRETDWNLAMARYWDLPQDERLQVNVLELRPFMAENDWNRVLTNRNSLQAASENKADAAQRAEVSYDKWFWSMAAEAGYTKGPGSRVPVDERNAKGLARAWRVGLENADRLRSAKGGKDLTDEELRNVAASIFAEPIEITTGKNRRVPPAFVTPEEWKAGGVAFESGEVYVPTEAQEPIANYLQSTGQKATPGAIAATWLVYRSGADPNVTLALESAIAEGYAAEDAPQTVTWGRGQIPPEEVTEIDRELEARGLPVTDENRWVVYITANADTAAYPGEE